MIPIVQLHAWCDGAVLAPLAFCFHSALGYRTVKSLFSRLSWCIMMCEWPRLCFCVFYAYTHFKKTWCQRLQCVHAYASHTWDVLQNWWWYHLLIILFTTVMFTVQQLKSLLFFLIDWSVVKYCRRNQSHYASFEKYWWSLLLRICCSTASIHRGAYFQWGVIFPIQISC